MYCVSAFMLTLEFSFRKIKIGVFIPKLYLIVTARYDPNYKGS